MFAPERALVGQVGSDLVLRREVAGVDAAFNYKDVGSLPDELGKHCPNGVDVYFENVGGAHLEAALEHMNNFGRLVLCGMISHYNEYTPYEEVTAGTICARAEAFVAEYLGGRSEPMTGDKIPGSTAIVREIGKK